MVPQARIIYLASLCGDLLACVFLALLRHRTGAGAANPFPGNAARYIVLALAAGILVALPIIRGRIRPLASDGDVTTWWRSQMGMVVAAWGLSGGLILAGGIFYFLTGDVLVLAASMLGVLLFLLHSPSRLV